MSVTLAAVAKKVAVMLASDKRTWKVVGGFIAMLIVLALLPVIVLLAMGNSLTTAGSQEIEVGEFMQNITPEQKELFSQMESDGKAIEDELTKLGLKTEIVKAQMIYLTYFDGVVHGENVFVEYCACFKDAADDKELILIINQKFGLSIDYEEFMRSYAMISNVSIDSYLFVKIELKNNIDLARWVNNAYETQWGYVPNSFGEVLSEERYKTLQEEYPNEIKEDCEQWLSRRTTDNLGLLYSYLWYDADTRMIQEDTKSTVQELYYSSSVKGKMDTIPDTVGTALKDGNTIGIYVGNDEVVFAKSIDDGIVKEKISDGTWTDWFQLGGITYGEEKSFSNVIQFEEYDETKKNNMGLVQWAIQAHENGWGYVYGTYGNVLTEGLLQDRASMYAGNVTNYMDFIRSNWMGKRTADCVGLIKGYGWYDSNTGELVVGSNGMADVGANGMFANAAVKGTIDTIPEVPGLAVWHDGHIGIYIGNGEVIEAMNTLRGVTRSPITYGNWTHWLQIPYISYVDQ